jgi:hypothetical protein
MKDLERSLFDGVTYLINAAGLINGVRRNGVCNVSNKEGDPNGPTDILLDKSLGGKELIFFRIKYDRCIRIT